MEPFFVENYSKSSDSKELEFIKSKLFEYIKDSMKKNLINGFYKVGGSQEKKLFKFSIEGMVFEENIKNPNDEKEFTIEFLLSEKLALSYLEKENDLIVEFLHYFQFSFVKSRIKFFANKNLCKNYFKDDSSANILSSFFKNLIKKGNFVVGIRQFTNYGDLGIFFSNYLLEYRFSNIECILKE